MQPGWERQYRRGRAGIEASASNVHLYAPYMPQMSYEMCENQLSFPEPVVLAVSASSRANSALVFITLTSRPLLFPTTRSTSPSLHRQQHHIDIRHGTLHAGDESQEEAMQGWVPTAGAHICVQLG